MFAAPDRPRAPYEALHSVLATLSRDDFELRCRARDRAFRDQGITFSHSGEERPFPLDLVPRIIDEARVDRHRGGGAPAGAWRSSASSPTCTAPGEILADGVVPRRLVASSEHFHRSVAGLEPPGGVRIHVAGIDLVRDDAGTFRVLEDNLRTPSGISYVVENRRAMTHVFPELFASHRIRRVSDYPQHSSKRSANTAPAGVDEPCVVVLTPGLHNAAYFEHSFLARQMGIELVEGRDLVCRDQCVYMRTTAGEQRVDVGLPPHRRRLSRSAPVPPRLRARLRRHPERGPRRQRDDRERAGNGVADDKAVYPFVPAMIEYYLGEVPILANVETYRLDDPDVCEWVVDRVDQLVCKPADGSGGYGLVIGPHASEATLVDLRVKLRANPRGWIAQQPIALSTAPTFVDGRMGPRHLDLRPFAVNDGRDIWVVPGGSTRVALPEGSLVVNSSQGGGSKDTWVLSNGHRRGQDAPAPLGPGGARRSRPPPRRRSARCPCTTASSNSSSSNDALRSAWRAC